MMPWTDPYTFTYTFVPIELGILSLPNFSISKVKPERGAFQQSDKDQLYLLSGFKSKVFVSSV